MPRTHALALVALAALCGADTARAQHPSTPACSVCPAYDAPVEAGHIADPALTEVSGLAASRAHPGIYYTHNDSGDRPRFFALDASGARRGEFQLAGATAIDYEDIAVGPCGAASCVYVGDVGDNQASRASVAIYRVEEPAIPRNARTPVALHAERIEFVYADQPHDVEALALDPSTGAAYVFTKEFAHTRVYRLSPPLLPGVRSTAQFVTEISVRGGLFPFVTAADIHPCAPRVLLRTYTGAFELRAPAGGTIEAALSTTPVSVPFASELQSEAIAYRADGMGYVTAPEGANVTMHEARCRPSAP